MAGTTEETGRFNDALQAAFFRNMTNAQLKGLAAQCRQAQLATVQVIVDFLAGMRTGFPLNSHWGRIDHGLAKLGATALLRTAHTVADAAVRVPPDTALRRESVPAPAASSKTVPTIVREKGPEKRVRPMDPSALRPRGPGATAVPFAAKSPPPPTLNVDAPDADAIAHMGQVMAWFVTNILAADDANEGIAGVRPSITTSEQATWLIHRVYLTHMSDVARYWASFQGAHERQTFIQLYPHFNFRTAYDPKLSLNAYENAVRKHENMTDEALERRRSLGINFMADAAECNTPSLPRRLLLYSAKDRKLLQGQNLLLQVEAQTLADRERVATALLEDLNWNLTLSPDITARKDPVSGAVITVPDEAVSMGRRTRAYHILNSTGIQMTTLVAAARGQLPWVVHRPWTRDVFDTDSTVDAIFTALASSVSPAETQHLIDHGLSLDLIGSISDRGIATSPTPVVFPAIERSESVKENDYIWANAVHTLPGLREYARVDGAIRRDVKTEPIASPLGTQLASGLQRVAAKLLALPSKKTVEDVGQSSSTYDGTLLDFLKRIDPNVASGTTTTTTIGSEALLENILGLYVGRPILQALWSDETEERMEMRLEATDRAYAEVEVGVDYWSKRGWLLSMFERNAAIVSDAQLEMAAIREILALVVFLEMAGTCLARFGGPGGPSVMASVDDYAHAGRDVALYSSLYKEFIKEVTDNVPTPVREALQAIQEVLRYGGYGPIDWHWLTGSTTPVPLLDATTLEVDALAIGVHVGVYERILRDYVWQWRMSHTVGYSGLFRPLVDRVRNLVATRRVEIPGYEQWLLRLDDQTARDFAQALPMFQTNMVQSVVLTMGHMTVGAAHYANLLNVFGVPYSWSDGHQFCLEAALLRGITTKGLVGLMERGAHMAHVSALGEQELPGKLGACVSLLTFLTTRIGRDFYAQIQRKMATKGTQYAGLGLLLYNWIDQVHQLANAYGLLDEGRGIFRYFDSGRQSTFVRRILRTTANMPATVKGPVQYVEEDETGLQTLSLLSMRASLFFPDEAEKFRISEPDETVDMVLAQCNAGQRSLPFPTVLLFDLAQTISPDVLHNATVLKFALRQHLGYDTLADAARAL